MPRRVGPASQPTMASSAVVFCGSVVLCGSAVVFWATAWAVAQRRDMANESKEFRKLPMIAAKVASKLNDEI